NLPDGRLLMSYTAGDVPTINAAVAVIVTAPAVTYPVPAATAIGTTTTRVSAIVDPHGADTGYSFDYGTSTAYGDTGDVGTLSAASGKQTVSSTLDGLTPATTYHFRVTAENSAGTTEGADESFTTAGCRLAPARDRGWEVALGHARTR